MIARKPNRYALLAAAALAASGCYSEEALIEKVRNRAIRNRIEEVPLGSFRVTLPHDQSTGEMTEVDVRLFGEIERYKVNEVESLLEGRRPQVEDRVMQTLRESPRAELAEADLGTLRGRLLASVNAELEEIALRAIGFYDVRFIRH